MSVLSTLSTLSMRYKAASAGAGLAGLVLVVYYILLPQPIPGIPYNKRAARRLLGDMPDIEQLAKTTLDGAQSVFFDVTTRRLGTPIAQVLLPGLWRPLVVIDDPREIEDILLRRGKEFDRGVLTADAFSPVLPKATLSQLTTPALRAQKKLWVDCMNAEFLRVVVAPNIVAAAGDLVELWHLRGAETFHVLDDFGNMALDVIYVAVVGENPGATRNTIDMLQGREPSRSNAFVIKDTVKYLHNNIYNNTTSLFPRLNGYLAYMKPSFWRMGLRSQNDMRRLVRLAVERFSKVDLGQLEGIDHDTCAMDMVLRRMVLAAKKEGRPVPDLSRDPSMTEELLTMLSAGHDSTSVSLSFFVKFMDLYPAVQARLRAELQAIFPDQQRPSADQILDAHIPYLDAVIEETLRFGGVVNCVSRLTLADTEVLGCVIPKGVEVILNARLNRLPFAMDEGVRSKSSRAAKNKRTSEGIEGPASRNLDVYDPERWLVRDLESGSDVFDPTALPTLCFGGGYRMCAGRKLALMEMRLVLTVLTLNFEFLDLPQELRGMRLTEKIFLQPDMAYARLRAL